LNNSIDCSDTFNCNSGEGFDHPIQYFNGIFDGRGFDITDLYINRPSSSNVGLFRTLTGNAFAGNFNLRDLEVNGGANTGSVVGHISGGKIYGVSANGLVTGIDYVGGISGLVNSTSFVAIRISFEGTVTGTGNYVEGLFGSGANLRDGFVDSYADANVTRLNNVGGIAGSMEVCCNNWNRIFAIGSATGNSNVGGLIGNSLVYSDVTLSNSYSQVALTGNTNVGGVVGNSETATGSVNLPVTNVHFDASYAGTTTAVGSGFVNGTIVAQNIANSDDAFFQILF
jgi:hypothetical protein